MKRTRGFNPKDKKTKYVAIMIHNIVQRLSVSFGFDTTLNVWTSPEKQLMLSVIHTALIDKFNFRHAYLAAGSIEDKKLVLNAKNYFNGVIWHSEICGVDSDYIRRIIKEEFKNMVDSVEEGFRKEEVRVLEDDTGTEKES